MLKSGLQNVKDNSEDLYGKVENFKESIKRNYVFLKMNFCYKSNKSNYSSIKRKLQKIKFVYFSILAELSPKSFCHPPACMSPSGATVDYYLLCIFNFPRWILKFEDKNFPKIILKISHDITAVRALVSCWPTEWIFLCVCEKYFFFFIDLRFVDLKSFEQESASKLVEKLRGKVHFSSDLTVDKVSKVSYALKSVQIPSRISP